MTKSFEVRTNLGASIGKSEFLRCEKFVKNTSSENLKATLQAALRCVGKLKKEPVDLRKRNQNDLCRS